MPAQPPAFTAFTKVASTSRRLTGADFLHILAGFVVTGLPLLALKPILRCLVAVVGT